LSLSPISLPQASASKEPPSSPLYERLKERVKGDVRFDALSRTLYATDASIYEIVPAGVVCPRSIGDVIAVVEECRRFGTSIVARGAGTGLTGGAIGPGVTVDLSRHMNRIHSLDVAARTIEVEPGVVLDELNAMLAPHGLHFAPDVATSSRATIGGMIANNSCGARSIIYGRTVDHVLELTAVLSDRRVVTFGGSRRDSIEDELGRIRDEYHVEIARRFPKILRNNGGYGLDRLGPPGTPAEALKVLCGSEGTLGIVVGAKLRLIPFPARTGLMALHFDDLFAALRTTPSILKHQPSAIELIDRMIVDAGRSNAALATRCHFLQGNPAALLVVEFQGESDSEVSSRIQRLRNDASAVGAAYAHSVVMEPRGQADVWKLRTSGLGLLMSKPGDEQPYSFIEDTAVDPTRLSEYIERLADLLQGEGVHAGYYAHASVGCIHVKPVLNLKRADDVERMRRVADGVCDLAVEFGGTVTGEHGDGIVRSHLLERLYGPRIIEAFRRVKALFDPIGLMNPHKIVDPWPMTEHLRHGPSFVDRSVKTYLDFSAHGGMAGLAGMCSGVGQCRQRLVGTMCPSYMATGDERDTTRARANALRVALSNRGLLDGLSDPHLAEVMDLCISCKACKTECPTGVDMARIKAEFLSHRNLREGVSRRARLIAGVSRHLAVAARFPRLTNALAQSSPMRRLVERRYGFDRRMPPPRLASTTFRAWFRRHLRFKERGGTGRTHRGPVIYFADTWTNYVTPQVGIAAVRLLEHMGYEVHCPPTYCCGRPAISQGLLTEAKYAAESNLRILTIAVPGQVPIVGTEPSCLSTLVDEYPQLVRAPMARRVADRVMLIESLLAKTMDQDPAAMAFDSLKMPVIFHAHCHQKAIFSTQDAVRLLQQVGAAGTREIDTGCCGMAGAFGHEVEHFEVAQLIGEQRLFPAIRDRGDAEVAISGFSCRHQIEHHTGVRPRHLVEFLLDRLSSRSI